jgi:hypothetical protein
MEVFVCEPGRRVVQLVNIRPYVDVGVLIGLDGGKAHTTKHLTQTML